jgi:hypothetical protein
LATFKLKLIQIPSQPLQLVRSEQKDDKAVFPQTYRKLYFPELFISADFKFPFPIKI